MLFFTALVLIVDTAIIAASVIFNVLPLVILLVWLLLGSLAVLALGCVFND